MIPLLAGEVASGDLAGRSDPVVGVEIPNDDAVLGVVPLPALRELLDNPTADTYEMVRATSTTPVVNSMRS